MKKILFHNGRIHTQSDRLVVDSMAIVDGRIVAVGRRLERDPDFTGYAQINLKGHTVVPGLVDAHTHFYQFAMQFGRVSLDGVDSLGKCLTRIKKFSQTLPKSAWVMGTGYSPDRFTQREEPDRYMLDTVTGGRPALIFSKDQHTAWVNSRALELGGITARTKQAAGSTIVRADDGTPTGILREHPAYRSVFQRIPSPAKREADRRYQLALDHAWRHGVTGLHSFDGPEGFTYFSERARQGKLGIRIQYYPSTPVLDTLERTKTFYGTGDSFLRIAGLKIFSDGALGSQTALCFNKYLGSRDNTGLATKTVAEMKGFIRRAARLGLPVAIHAIGDKAVDNVLTAMEAVPGPKSGVRHRIEHLQLMRRKDIVRVKRLGVIASMQPSHCPSDIKMMRKYWGTRSRNAFLFRTLADRGIDLAFGSDAPIEPLDPIAGIEAAVRRARVGSRDVFCPEQRITAAEALYAYTVGPAIACGLSHERGYLLPGYRADFAVLDQDLTRIAPSRIGNTKALATVIDGRVCFSAPRLRWKL